MCEFTHLHVHSDGSTPISHDGLGNVSRLVSAAKEKNFKSLALTDHGNLINVPSFLSACKHSNIKPIIGLEAYIQHESENFHLTLLSDGNEGFETLTNLNNLAQKDWIKARPTFKLTDFETHNKGLIVLTGCPSSPLQKLDYKDALDIGVYLKGIFGNNLFSEIMYSGFGEPETLERSVKLANKLKIPLITTNDVHFPYANDALIHRMLSQMLTDGHMDYDSELLYLATQDELEQRIHDLAPDFIKHFKIGMANAIKLADKLDVVKLDNTLSLPKIENPDAKLNELIVRGLSDRHIKGDLTLEDEVYERLQYEFDIIKSMDFSTYFIILNDMVSYAKSINVKIGSGRGSGAGSLILYALGITDINPLTYDLKFERFINPKRLDFPDVDIDYDSKGRYEVIKYAKDRWGAIPVATYSRYSDDSLHNDLTKYFEIDKGVRDSIKENGINSEYYKKFVSENPFYGECYNAISGQMKHIGKHAGGVVITDKNIPTIHTSSGEIVASWTEGLHGKELSEVGVIKYDILGVSSLDVLAELESKHGLAPKPIDDSPVFDLFKNGDTLGIFQFTQSGITQFTQKIQPTKFLELVAINAVWRPGAMQAAGVHYPEYKNNGQRLLHPLIDDILAETYGVIVYQEQFMSIYAKVTGKDFGDADLARKTLTKAQGKENDPIWQQKIQDLGNEIIQGCLKCGMTEKTANQIWSEIKTHSGYSFNKSHSVSYTMLSWQLAYFKYYHRADFYAASLNANDAKSEQYLFDVIRSGIEVVPPDINKSTDKYISDGNKIYMPLTAIKGISDNGYEAILNNRPFSSIQDFVDKVPKRKVNKAVKKKLLDLGCFDSIIVSNDLFGTIPPHLELDVEPFGGKTFQEIQKESFGYVLPTREFFEAVKTAETKGYIAGVINRIEEKKSKNGNKYLRLFLYPSGIIRTYDTTIAGFNVGDEVMIKCKPNVGYGNESISIQELEYM